MIDLTEGWVWFASGLGLTVLFAVLALVTALAAKRSERRQERLGR